LQKFEYDSNNKVIKSTIEHTYSQETYSDSLHSFKYENDLIDNGGRLINFKKQIDMLWF